MTRYSITIDDRYDELDARVDELQLLIDDMGNVVVERIDIIECPTCVDVKANGGFGPSHDASPRCESGKYPHCSCDVCF